ncbi:MAG: rhomboid family intramembrane serine protease [Campylobacter sp.]|nr:rhomboid family intramembrane serine protease [Campylobacter sp.]
MKAVFALIAANLLVFAYFSFDDFLYPYLALNIGFLRFGLYHQVLSSMFLHANLAHIAMNMAVLYSSGVMLENRIGNFKFLLFYLLCGVATSFLSFFYIYFFDENVMIVGASGAISAVLGAIAYLGDKQSAKGLFLALLLMSFAPLLFGENIAWYAHLIGFGLGFLYAKIFFKV